LQDFPTFRDKENVEKGSSESGKYEVNMRQGMGKMQPLRLSFSRGCPVHFRYKPSRIGSFRVGLCRSEKIFYSERKWKGKAQREEGVHKHQGRRKILKGAMYQECPMRERFLRGPVVTREINLINNKMMNRDWRLSKGLSDSQTCQKNISEFWGKENHSGEGKKKTLSYVQQR